MKISFILSSTTHNLNFISWIKENIQISQITLIFILSDYPIITHSQFLIFTPFINKIRKEENIKRIKETVEQIKKISNISDIITIVMDEEDQNKLHRALKTTKPDLVVINKNFRLKNFIRLDDFIGNIKIKMIKIPTE
ncbi:hypothetical protein SLOPH_1007 [Spraguea lophii 42_110]|uniref:Uncharacterized protein n=1 Tax=Spraguea lophii (strain 42_110) TaxID=1358809 RepID=S7W7P0_SPRLO|nr:hypothetical protein SLOPH_1007 [Spraguea lophii 42_110]